MGGKWKKKKNREIEKIESENINKDERDCVCLLGKNGRENVCACLCMCAICLPKANVGSLVNVLVCVCVCVCVLYVCEHEVG